jgi:ubiquinone/menaquinone biosynthesis C-methylase UbiE
MTLLPRVSATEERQFQSKSISQQRERYLSTDVLQKIQMDTGYAEKVRQVERALDSPGGLIVDIGSNTCGESEYLTTRGYPILCTDINEVALQLSQERCRKYKRKSPSYLACDAHHLPLQNGSAQFVIFNESLHHMEDTMRVLHEVERVLAPGGRIFLYEPYAYNPYRRLSEIRDRFLGTIERSFGVSQLRRLFRDAGLSVVSIDRHTCAPSQCLRKNRGELRRRIASPHWNPLRGAPSQVQVFLRLKKRDI